MYGLCDNKRSIVCLLVGVNQATMEVKNCQTVKLDIAYSGECVVSMVFRGLFLVVSME